MSEQIYIFFRGYYQDNQAFDGNAVIDYIGEVKDRECIRELTSHLVDLTEKSPAANGRKATGLSIVNMIRLPF